MVQLNTVQTTTLSAGCALALVAAALGDQARAEVNLDASYTISFARIRVGDITANLVLGDTEYAITARGQAGGIMKVIMNGEGTFTTRGTMKDGHPVPTNFTSKIVSNGEKLDVTMVLDEGRVKELTAVPLPSPGRVPVTEANRQGIIDPLTAMLLWAPADRRRFVSRGVPAHTSDFRRAATLRSQALFQTHGQGNGRKRIRWPGGGVLLALRTNRRPFRDQHPCQISFRRP